MAHVCAMLDVHQSLEVSDPESVPIILARPTMQLLLVEPGSIQPESATGGATPVHWLPKGCATCTVCVKAEEKKLIMQKTAETGRGSSRHLAFCGLKLTTDDLFRLFLGLLF